MAKSTKITTPPSGRMLFWMFVVGTGAIFAFPTIMRGVNYVRGMGGTKAADETTETTA